MQTLGKIVDDIKKGTSQVEKIYRGEDLVWRAPPMVLRDDAVLWLDAKYSSPYEQTALNRGNGGSALNAQYGSSANGVAIKDGAVKFNGVSNNFVSAAHNSTLAFSNNWDVSVRFKWSSLGSGALLAKDGPEGNNPGRTFDFLVTNSGGPGSFVFYLTNSSGVNATNPGFYGALPNAGFSSEDLIWSRWTFVSGVLTLYLADGSSNQEPTTWTLIGSQVCTINDLRPGTADVVIGARNKSTDWLNQQTVYRTIIKNGVGGTTVLDVNMENVPDRERSFIATTGQTVTVSSSSVDTNDPVLLTHTGENYFYFPESPGKSNGLSGPTLTTVNNDSWDLRLDVYADLDGVNGVSQSRITLPSSLIDWKFSAGSFRHFPGLNTGIKLTAVQVSGSEIETELGSRRGRIQIRSGWDNNAARSYVYARKYSGLPLEDDTGWNLYHEEFWPGQYSIGATQTFQAFRNLSGYGSENDSTMYEFLYTVNNAVVLNIKGSDIIDSDATTFTASSGQTITIYRETTARKTALVTRPIWLFGTDDYLDIPNNPLINFNSTDEFTLVLVHRVFAGNSVFRRALSKEGLSGYYVTLVGTSSGFGIRDTTGYPNPIVNASTYGLRVLVGTRDASSELITTHINNLPSVSAADTTPDDLTATQTLRIGANTQSSLTGASIEVLAAAVIRRTLNNDEISEILNYYQDLV